MKKFFFTITTMPCLVINASDMEEFSKLFETCTNLHVHVQMFFVTGQFYSLVPVYTLCTCYGGYMLVSYVLEGQVHPTGIVQGSYAS